MNIRRICGSLAAKRFEYYRDIPSNPKARQARIATYDPGGFLIFDSSHYGIYLIKKLKIIAQIKPAVILSGVDILISFFGLDKL